MRALVNKERIVFLSGLVIFLIGLATVVTRAPLGSEDPSIPLLPDPESGVKVRTLSAVFPGPSPEYPREELFSLGDVWSPPKPSHLADPPVPPAGYAVPQVTFESVGRSGIDRIQTRPPKEVVKEESDEEDGEVDGAGG